MSSTESRTPNASRTQAAPPEKPSVASVWCTSGVYGTPRAEKNARSTSSQSASVAESVPSKSKIA